MNPRIFVSHSNYDQEALEFIELLKPRAVAAGLDVLIDREHIPPGVDWRDELYTWMGMSTGAVVLLSPSVLDPDKPWVARESGILLWRRTLNPNFLVVPVYLGGFSEENLNEGFFAGLQMQDIESVKERDPEIAVEKLVGMLENLRVESPTPLETVADMIASQLKGLDEDIVPGAADLLDVDLGPWNPTANARRSLALKMLQVGLRDATKALKFLAGHLQNPASIRRIARWLEPSWVDLSAARWVAHCACSPHRAAVMVNVKRQRSADMYIRRASCQDAQAWPSLPITGIHGEDALADIVAEVKESLITKFRLEPDAFIQDPEEQQKDKEEQLLNLLKLRNEEGSPVFILMLYSEKFAPKLGLLQKQLEKDLKAVTLFVLAGDDFPDDQNVLASQGIFVVEPKVGPGIENQAITECNNLLLVGA